MASWAPRRSTLERSLRGESRAAGERDVDAGVTSLATLRSRGAGWSLFTIACAWIDGVCSGIIKVRSDSYGRGFDEDRGSLS